MTNADYDRAVQAATDLAEVSDEGLLEELGLRIRDMENLGGYARAQEFQAGYSQVAEDMLSIKDLKVIGQRLCRNLEPELMTLVCDAKSEDLKKITSGGTIPQIAASLATAGVVATLGPPAWVIVATTIIAHKIAQSGLKAVCQTWQESLDARTEKPPES